MRNIYRLFKLNRFIKGHRLKFAYVWLAHRFGFRHLFVKFDPVIACNLSCGMCHFSDRDWRRKNKGIFKEEEVERIAGMLFPRALHVTVGCTAEPTMYKKFPELVKLAKRHGVPNVSMVSNGQLLTEDHLECMLEYGLGELILSLHGVRKETYEKLMVNSSYEKFHKLLQMVDAVKARRKSSTPILRINYTVNPDNLDELADFFDVFGRYCIDAMQIRPIMDFGNTAYRNKDMSEQIAKYNEIIKKLSAISKQRKMIFMATVIDPTYRSEVYSSVIVDSVLRFVSPQLVWKPDFDWRNESYDEYCRRIDWTGQLKQGIVSSMDTLPKRNTATTYEVIN